MAKLYKIDSEELKKNISRSYQSAHIHFLLGAGASYPAIPLAGSIEQEISNEYESGQDSDAAHRMFGFLSGVQEPMNQLILNQQNEENELTLENYREFICNIERILSERRTTILPKQATIFTTNYDLFIEQASNSIQGIILNDGFDRRPKLDNCFEFSSNLYFRSIYNTGNLYQYKVEIPCINLVKMHGSLSWKNHEDGIVYDVRERTTPVENGNHESELSYIEEFAIVLPQTTKFRTTLMDRTYYELLRIYANALDKENTLLTAFGFSFEDIHILNITRRALKNSTLLLIAIAYNEEDRIRYTELFDGYNNVHIIHDEEDKKIDFQRFNILLSELFPTVGEIS